MENPVGLRFRPTDEEIVDDYLRPKNIGKNTSYIEGVISTVTICNFDPWELPSQSRIKLKDQEWCFFSRKEKKYEKGERQIRQTKSGYWKITGKPTDIMRTSANREKIGEKKVLMFYTTSKSRTDWVMHEYHVLSPDQVMTYTICKVIFKGAADIELEHSSSLMPPVNNIGDLSTGSEGPPFELQTNLPRFTGFPDVDALDNLFDNILSDDFKDLLDDSEESKVVYMNEDCSVYRPKKSLTGVLSGYSSDDESDSGSISQSTTTNSIGYSITCDSFGSSNHRIDHITDLQASPTIKLVTLTQEVSKAMGTSTDTSEKKSKIANLVYRMIQKLVKKIHLCSSNSKT